MPPTAKTAAEKLAKIAALVRHPEIRRTRIKREVLEAIEELTEDIDPADEETTPTMPSAAPVAEPVDETTTAEPADESPAEPMAVVEATTGA